MSNPAIPSKKSEIPLSRNNIRLIPCPVKNFRYNQFLFHNQSVLKVRWKHIKLSAIKRTNIGILQTLSRPLLKRDFCDRLHSYSCSRKFFQGQSVHPKDSDSRSGGLYLVRSWYWWKYKGGKTQVILCVFYLSKIRYYPERTSWKTPLILSPAKGWPWLQAQSLK